MKNPKSTLWLPLQNETSLFQGNTQIAEWNNHETVETPHSITFAELMLDLRYFLVTVDFDHAAP